MRNVIELQKKLLPDLLDVMKKRYRILQYLRLRQPVGRRTLARSLDLSERVLRSEVMFLKEQNLVHIGSGGMTLTEGGENLLEGLEEVMKDVSGLSDMESQLASELNVQQAIIVSGNSDRYSWVKKEMGRACVRQMKEQLEPQDVVAVAGGTTLAAVAEMMSPDDNVSSVSFVPARGGLGEKVEIQSNTISSTMAQKAHGNYRLLHVPDQLSDETRESLVLEPGIKELLHLIRQAKMVIHGVGEAETMAARRKTKAETLESLKDKQAVAEAFGYYFDRTGCIVHKENTIGLQLDDLSSNQVVMTVAGGASKAEAITAYMKYRPSDVLITDEGAAQAMLRK
ncbi:central glycolytic genes regulator [Alteribacillus persepolensis]|uniref:Central glycolytic genes regulator n=1 Tax=Alteribacillus persepolensis TaxID=568899 RepID=A0A1G8AK16_9BACI|nr:sugar-binding domain-containing protein [Alteribacillus persepolensis]SDH21291.1 central glycolytic genes regulator [Alteribacillus persepolensis]